ncbi:TonB-dependent receptor domain-containing protein [Rufibacter immobilis]|uniref:TonB-dependent receptor domain-containing protein n=1 Tax=Rufibacter immobilis TaxID=1348778 RepID=UPI0035EEE6D6
MKKRYLFLQGLLCLFLSVAAAGQAQTTSASAHGAGKITGLVLDSLSGKPVAYATVALRLKNSTQALDGMLTNDKGQFSFHKVGPGVYTLTFSFIGYAAKTVQDISITAQTPDADAGTIQLHSAANKLQEVTVVGQKPLIEDKGDRLVYNAEQDITNAGGNAADVLKKVPSLAVDPEGNVQLRGSANVRVLINGKTSNIMASSLADALKQIPADNIKSVEVMTNPPAKYDAEGTGGVINIITKKNSLQGTSGSVGVALGTVGSNGFGNLNVRKGKLGVNAGLNGFKYYVRRKSLMRRQEGEALTNQTAKGKIFGGGASAQLGLDYELDSLNLFSAGIKLNLGRYQGRMNQVTTSPAPGLYQTIYSQNHFQFKPLGTDLNVDYTHIFKPQQELTFLAQWSQSDIDNRIDQDRQNTQEQLYYVQRNTNDNFNREITLQLDYTQAFASKASLETGLKTILRRAESNALYDITFPLENRAAPGQNLLHYDQNVMAGYVTYGGPLLKNYTYRAGARYEHTFISGDFTSNTTHLKNQYGRLVPSLYVSRTFKKDHTVKVSYTQRIQRPYIFYLNPYRDTRDPKNVTYGNPALSPELTHTYELGYSTFFKTSSVNASVFLNETNNAIQPLIRLEEDIAFTTYGNAGKSQGYGLSLSGSTKPVAAWSINGSMHVQHSRFQSPFAQNSGWQYFISLNTSYEFGKGISAQFFGSTSSSNVTLQGKSYGWNYFSLAVKKELFDKKGSVSLAADNIFTQTMRFGYETRPPAFTQTLENRNYNRSVRVTFDYKFGQADAKKAARQKKSIDNNDVKQGQ